MAGTEPQLPVDTVSSLRLARDQIVACVEEWSTQHRRGRTIGHAGRVTLEFLKKQAGKGLRSVITVLGGNNERLAGGTSVQFLVSWGWFVAVPGTLENRTTAALDFVGEAARFATLAPWGDLADTCFSRTPVRDSVRLSELYKDADEKTGLSIWLITWRQAIDLGPASRGPDPAPDPLEIIRGTTTIEGDPNPDTLETTVE